jgi:hypothetical protein
MYGLMPSPWKKKMLNYKSPRGENKKDNAAVGMAAWLKT